ncbi:MAG: hypothetical protein MZU97_01580 [Bacillus subtilis]|nr:hypothetical protein [Bacillus subtilis]
MTERRSLQRYQDQIFDASAQDSKKSIGKTFGDNKNPFWFRFVPGARVSMPGMMDTILNLGLNDETVEGLGQADQQPALRLRLLSPLHPDVRRRRAWTSTEERLRARSVERRQEREAASSSTPS